MDPYDVFITYISWKGGGKSRPVLLIKKSVNDVYVYPITTRYRNKSKPIQAQYFKINDWKESGLDRQSYIDTGRIISLPLRVIMNKNPIGTLTSADRERLKEFLKK